MRGSFNSDGMLKRERKKKCAQCGSKVHCDVCWEHVESWSPFGIWHCLVCRMPQFMYDARGASWKVMRCDFCGWDEAVSTTKAEHS